MSTIYSTQKLTAFASCKQIAFGECAQVLAQIGSMTFPQDTSIRVFGDETGECLDFDLRVKVLTKSAMGKSALSTSVVRSMGRPRLEVVAGEVPLLPRHWEQFDRQPGGTSVALRRMVDEGRKIGQGRDSVRAPRETACRSMRNMAGALPGYEHAARALFRGNKALFEKAVAHWPADFGAQRSKPTAAGWIQT